MKILKAIFLFIIFISGYMTVIYSADYFLVRGDEWPIFLNEVSDGSKWMPVMYMVLSGLYTTCSVAFNWLKPYNSKNETIKDKPNS